MEERRIGRGEKQSYCIFMSTKKNDATMKRLNILNKSNDGFFIASEDMKLRGPGDLFGIRQSGDMHFNLADIFNDVNILKEKSILMVGASSSESGKSGFVPALTNVPTSIRLRI